MLRLFRPPQSGDSPGSPVSVPAPTMFFTTLRWEVSPEPCASCGVGVGVGSGDLVGSVVLMGSPSPTAAPLDVVAVGLLCVLGVGVDVGAETAASDGSRVGQAMTAERSA